jgi:hypothetical protein
VYSWRSTRTDGPTTSDWRGFAVTESLAIGGLFFGLAGVNLTSDGTVARSRVARFRRDRATAGQASDVVLARYEGELSADAARARIDRRMNQWLAAGTAVSGAGLIIVGTASPLRGDARVITYLEGGGLLIAGAVESVLLSTTQSATEGEWNRYRLGAEPAARSALHFKLSPVVSRQTAALYLTGSF